MVHVTGHDGKEREVTTGAGVLHVWPKFGTIPTFKTKVSFPTPSSAGDGMRPYMHGLLAGIIVVLLFAGCSDEGDSMVSPAFEEVGDVFFLRDGVHLCSVRYDGTDVRMLFDDRAVLSYDVSQDGAAVAMTLRDDHNWSIGHVHILDLTDMSLKEYHRHAWSEVSWSPDGKKLAFAARYVNYYYGTDDTLYVLDMENGLLTPLARKQFIRNVSWSPDGKYIAFLVGSSAPQLHTVEVATRDIIQLTTPPGRILNPSWAPTSDAVVFQWESGIQGQSEIVAMDISSGQRTNVTNDGAVNFSPRYSPDGKTIAYTIDSFSEGSVWLYDVGTRTPRSLTPSNASYSTPVWAPDSRRVFYRRQYNGERGIYSHDVETGVVIKLTEGRDEQPRCRWR
jgi:Tol biopolymer transport system component